MSVLEDVRNIRQIKWSPELGVHRKAILFDKQRQHRFHGVMSVLEIFENIRHIKWSPELGVHRTAILFDI